MNIAILGYGTVGKGVDIILQNNESVHVSCILERAERINEDTRMTSCIDDIINDDSISGVVETMGGIDTAYEYIRKAMKAGKFVVTANKAVIAAYFKELHELAKEQGVRFAYEASVGGVLPIIHVMDAMNRFEDVTETGGILNGTSNYILDMMTKQHISFATALRDAQEAGYAERDPSADIDGIDVKNKLMILSSLAFHQVSEYDKLDTTGIRYISKDDIEYFVKHGTVCKLFARALRENDTYTGSIEPTLFPKDSVFANVSVNNNAAFVYSKSSGQIILHGQGAGQLPTGHAVVQDLMDIAEGRGHEFTCLNSYTFMMEEKEAEYYLRTTANMSKYRKFIRRLGNDQYHVCVSNVKEWRMIRDDIQKQDEHMFYARYDVSCVESNKYSGVKD